LIENGRQPSEVGHSQMKGLVFGRDEVELQRNLDGQDARALLERGMIVGTPSVVVDQPGQLAEVGVQQVMFQWADMDDLDGLEAFAQMVLPQVQYANRDQRIRHPGTFNANPLSAAAGVATLEIAATGEPQEWSGRLTLKLHFNWKELIRPAHQDDCRRHIPRLMSNRPWPVSKAYWPDSNNGRYCRNSAQHKEDNMYQPNLETMSQAELRDLQLSRLRETLDHIHATNPAYVEHLGGLGSKDVRSLEDLRNFPFLTKRDLREGYPYRFACAPRSDFVRMQMSSGSTGTPVICPHTETDVNQWGEIMARCLAAAGVTPEDVIQITPSFGLFNGGFGFHYGASLLKTMIIPIGAGRSSLQLRFMKELGTTALGAISSYPLRLMEVARRDGFDFRKETDLRIGIFGAEPWSEGLRQRIETEMGITTFDIIGMTETAGVGLGIDCPARQGIHVWEDHYLIEFIDPDTGEALPDGPEGEMVVTTLTREALPLIRLRTRDITGVRSREVCSCGRTHLRVERIERRTDDMLKVKGINFYPNQIESILMRHEDVATDYLIRLSKEAGKDQLWLTVEVTEPGDETLVTRLREEIFDLLGLHANRLELVPVGTIERSPGKAVRVIDER
jgi:phenylacetate-CoA ligase